MLVISGGAGLCEPQPPFPNGTIIEGSQPQTQTPSGRQDRRYEVRGTEEHPLVIKALPAERTKEQAAQDAQERQDKSAADWWLVKLTGAVAIATIALVVVTGGLVLLGLKQIKDIRVSVDAATKAANAAFISATATVEIERPRIVAWSNVVIKPSTEGGQTTYIRGIPKDAILRVAGSNIGRTPAEMRGWGLGFSICDTLPEKPIYDKTFDYKPGILLIPGKDINIEQNMTFGEGAIDALKDHKFFVFGYFAYLDFIGSRHIDRFCFQSAALTSDDDPIEFSVSFDAPIAYIKYD
ncbi:MAG: hypothetical protein WDN46_15225 [Methylocella sp.]